jgi:uncharacterized protein
MTDAMQERVFDTLSDARNHGGAPVRRIDTHAASVFLAGPRALKVKRAVRFPFLDYSTLAKRKAACEAELEVNRAFAPDLYRRVVAITQEPDGALAVDGSGKAVEWAVEMRRFDETRTLDHLADRGELDAALAERLAVMVEAAHASAAEASATPWLENFEAILAQNEQELAQYPSLFAADAAAALSRASRAAFARLRPLLAERQRLGAVRRCHGDLHLGNIVLIDGSPMLFDAIEFSDAIAIVDVFYDLAFLLMDLGERGLDVAANRVLNRYLQQSGRSEDLDALAALPLFMSVRAAIRAKVTAARLADAAGEKHAAFAQTARTYFELARRLIEPPAPRLVAVGGLSGTGKSVLARGLAPSIAPAPGAVVLRSDVARKMLFGVAETARLPKEAYSMDVSRRVYAALEDKAKRALAAGHSAIVDAVFARESERAAVRKVAADAGVSFAGLFLQLDLSARKARLEGRVGDASDATSATADVQEQYDLGSLDWTTVDASGSPEDMFRRACEALKSR